MLKSMRTAVSAAVLIGASTTLVGFAGYRGTVIAASAWGEQEQLMRVPAGRDGSHESLLHHALGRPALLDFGDRDAHAWPSVVAPHRAIGVIYHPDREAGNYVPTVMGSRYDALLWLEDTTGLVPLPGEHAPGELEFETEPSGF
jgi:erythromycin esterase